jgi:hypothetical protein
VSGTATAGNPMHHKGLACRVVLYRTTFTGPTDERSTKLTWCKTKDGWK